MVSTKKDLKKFLTGLTGFTGFFGSSIFTAVDYHVLRSPSPLPSPQGEGEPPPVLIQIATVLTRCVPTWLPLLGERVGVRGNAIGTRNEPHKCKLQLPSAVKSSLGPLSGSRGNKANSR